MNVFLSGSSFDDKIEKYINSMITWFYPWFMQVKLSMPRNCTSCQAFCSMLVKLSLNLITVQNNLKHVILFSGVDYMISRYVSKYVHYVSVILPNTLLIVSTVKAMTLLKIWHINNNFEQIFKIYQRNYI